MSEVLESILDDCIEKVRAGRTIEEALSEYPRQAEELRPLLELSIGLEELPCPAPDWRKMAETLAAATTAPPKSKPSIFQWIQDFFTVPALARAVTVSLVLFVLGWGGVNASSNAVPGDWLYPIKLLTERAQFFLTLNPNQKAELRIVYSSKRLKEAVMQHERDGTLNEELLASMLEEARLAIKESTALSDSDHRMIVSRATSNGDYQKNVLSEFQAKSPAQVQQRLTRWIDMCAERGRWMQGLVEQPIEIQPKEPNETRSGKPVHIQPEESPQQRLNRCMGSCPMW